MVPSSWFLYESSVSRSAVTAAKNAKLVHPASQSRRRPTGGRRRCATARTKTAAHKATDQALPSEVSNSELRLSTQVLNQGQRKPEEPVIGKRARTQLKPRKAVEIQARTLVKGRLLPRGKYFSQTTTRVCDDGGMIHSNGATFPFAAIVGQDLMRLSLALNAINPSIGGVLIRGERGTAKSTAVRGLAAVLPEIEVATCAYGCAPGSLNVALTSQRLPSGTGGGPQPADHGELPPSRRSCHTLVCGGSNATSPGPR